MSGFALVVIILAAIGIDAVMASFVVQHRLVFRQGMILAGIGIAVGL